MLDPPLKCFLLLTLLVSVNSWHWTCENGFCNRNSSPSSNTGYSSLELCQLLCTDYLNIWPQPTKSVTSLKNVVNVDFANINFQINGPDATKTYLESSINYFRKNLKNGSDCPNNVYPTTIILEAHTDELELNLDTNESYCLEINCSGDALSMEINAPTVFGVRHGLETLLQLLVIYTINDLKCLATLSYVQISDKPVYRHRGLLIDTSRNFLEVETIKRTIDGMAASKLNVLHWHITDSQSFPLELKSLPNMTKYGAYSEDQIYKPANVKDIVEYAKVRGIRILLEIDGPSHAGQGWQWSSQAGLGNLAVCVNEQPWRVYCVQPPCGQLNPSNSALYDVMKQMFGDVNDLLDDTGMFHLGGDEVSITCWNSTQEIIYYLRGKPLTEETYMEFWSAHQRKLLTTYDDVVGHKKTSIVLWTSSLTQPEVIEKYLPKDRYIIQTWVPEENIGLITELLNLGYKVIISTKDKWYLDHGFWGTTNYYKWTDVYNNPMYSYYNEGVLGGEVCMWGELVDDNNIHSRIWPRAAAAAERLWSNPRTTSDKARGRFYAHRERLVNRGIPAEAVTPTWCVQNQEDCSFYL